ncbi:hypothetical protein B0H13DRAFT_1872636 [Mycena leptocephala]|nr:hypothetical protein B0H13DRAFT_1872636 [Mycena leptocephala]
MSLPTFSFSTTADDVAAVFATDIEGRNGQQRPFHGIGFETARAITKYAGLVVIAGYNLERYLISSPNPATSLIIISSLAAVGKAASEVKTYPKPLQVLIHNAVAPISFLKHTMDNLEIQIQTDYIGLFLFAKRVAKKLLTSSTESYVPRVVTPGAGDIPKILGSVSSETGGLHASAKGRHTTAFNGLVGTGDFYLGGENSSRTLAHSACGFLGQDSGIGWKTIPQGAATTVAAAFDTRLNGLEFMSENSPDIPGAFLSDSTEASKEVAPHGSDPRRSDYLIAEKLWNEIIGVEFAFEEKCQFRQPDEHFEGELLLFAWRQATIVRSCMKHMGDTGSLQSGGDTENISCSDNGTPLRDGLLPLNM